MSRAKHWPGGSSAGTGGMTGRSPRHAATGLAPAHGAGRHTPASLTAAAGPAVTVLPAHPMDHDTAMRRLRGACAQLALGLSDPVFEGLWDYLNLLQRWNAVYNLTAVRRGEDMLRQHLLDCLAVLGPLQRHVQQQMSAAGASASIASNPRGPVPPWRVLDVGSGGGLPGVLLALAHADWQVDCVDAVAKKVSFIRQVAAQLPLPNLRGLHGRVEALAPPGAGASAGYQVVTARAFASLVDFTSWTRHLLAPGGCWMAMKGKVPDDELADLPVDIEVFHVEQLAVPELDAQRCLVWMRPRVPGRPAAADKTTPT